MSAPHGSVLERFEAALAAQADVFFELTLFVSGASPLSVRAISNARLLCDTHLAGRNRLFVVDVQNDPEAMLNSGVLAAPTLIRSQPLPARMLVGDLSNTAKVLKALDLAGLATTSPTS